MPEKIRSNKVNTTQDNPGVGEKDGSEIVQLPFRCSRQFSARLVRAKGSMMRVTGEKVSDNKFFLMLAEIGLKEIEAKYGESSAAQ